MKRLFIITFVIGAAILQPLSAHALSVTFANDNPTTDIYVDWSITGLYTETFTGATYVEGPWTLTLDSPVPASLPGSSDPWSIRVALERSGLTGESTDYVGGTPAVSIDTQDVLNFTGDFLTYWNGKGYGINLTDPDTWIVTGSVTMDPDTPSPIPDASTLFLLGSACLIGLSGLRRKPRK